MVALNGVSNEELLHAVVGLYDTYLSDITPQVLYSTVCGKWAKTLLLVRTLEDFLQEQEEKGIEIENDNLFSTQNGQNTLSILGDNSTTKIDGSGLRTSQGKGGAAVATCWGPETHATCIDGFTSIQSLKSKTEDKNNLDNSDQSTVHEDSKSPIAVSKHNDKEQKVSTSNRCGETDEKNDELIQFSGVFSDTDESEESSEEEEEEEEFSKGVDLFIEAVKKRRIQRHASDKMYASSIGIENLLIGATTFERSYSKPGEKIIQINLLGVRKRFRKSGVGKFMVNVLKDPTMHGAYDSIAVYVDADAVDFFKSCGFTDDVVLNSRFSKLTDPWINSTLMCYLPPFSGSDVSGVYRGAVEMKALQGEIQKWREKSLEAYQAQQSCMVRMQHEITTLRAVVERQEETITQLTKDNEKLESTNYQLEKQILDCRLNAYGKSVEDSNETDEDVDLYESLAEILSKNHVTESEVEAVAQGDLRSVTPETEKLVFNLVTSQSEKQLSQHIRKSLVTIPGVKKVEIISIKKVEPTCIISMETGFDSRTQKLGDPSMCTQMYFCGGATDMQIDRIMRWGFSKQDFTAGEYGAGLYFSIHPSRAAQFSVPGKLLIANVGLGLTESVVRLDKSRIFPPAGFDSIVTPGRALVKRERTMPTENQEYVIFDQLQAVPVYLVEYCVTRS